MNLSIFYRFCPSMKTMAQLEERVDLSKDNRNEERYGIPMHRNTFGLISRCKNLEFFFVDCRSNTMILVRSTGEVGEHARERED
jgi:hypothetical protein